MTITSGQTETVRSKVGPVKDTVNCERSKRINELESFGWTVECEVELVGKFMFTQFLIGQSLPRDPRKKRRYIIRPRVLRNFISL